MGILRNNNNNEELVKAVNNIADNLYNRDKYNEFQTQVKDLEFKLMEEQGVLSGRFDNLKKGVNEYTKTIGNLCNRLDEQEKIINNLTRQADENYNLIIKQEKCIKQLVKIVDKYGEIVKEHLLDEEETTPPVNSSYRKYSTSIRKRKPKLIRLNKDGKFTLKNGKLSKWNINDILYLKKLIPQTHLKTNKLSEKTGLKENTVLRLCCAIEDGDFDKYLREWEQINADNTYGNWKPEIINNPEKRRENNYV